MKSRSYCRDYLEKSKKQVIAVGLNYTPKKGVTALFQTTGLRGKKPDYHLAYRFPPKIGTRDSRRQAIARLILLGSIFAFV